MTSKRQRRGHHVPIASRAESYRAQTSSAYGQPSLLDPIQSSAPSAPTVNNLGSGKIFRGVTQLSLVEHALCPLDPKESLKRGMVYDSHYFRFTSGWAERIDVENTAGHVRLSGKAPPSGLEPTGGFQPRLDVTKVGVSGRFLICPNLHRPDTQRR